jgi:hypothetical protein
LPVYRILVQRNRVVAKQRSPSFGEALGKR